LLRGPVRGGDSRHDADQPRRGEEPYRAWYGLPAGHPGAGRRVTDVGRYADELRAAADSVWPVTEHVGAALLGTQDVGAAGLGPQLIGAALLGTQDVGAAGLGAQLIGAAGLGAEY